MNVNKIVLAFGWIISYSQMIYARAGLFPDIGQHEDWDAVCKKGLARRRHCL
jgi:hypothetical protein